VALIRTSHKAPKLQDQPVEPQEYSCDESEETKPGPMEIFAQIITTD